MIMIHHPSDVQEDFCTIYLGGWRKVWALGLVLGVLSTLASLVFYRDSSTSTASVLLAVVCWRVWRSQVVSRKLERWYSRLSELTTNK